MPCVRMEKTCFAEGTFRHAYRLLDLSSKKGDQDYVAKISKDHRDQMSDNYWQEVQVQAVSKLWAKKFNEHPRAPPKKVDFLVAFVLQMFDRPDSPMCGVEKFVHGEYIKWSNNWDFVDDRRNTPHAFSHFTYEASGHRLVVCDVQGVGDLYTDPQIHSVDLATFGKGNLGQKGIDAFCKGHKCNAICRGMGLPFLGSDPISDESGTCPAVPRPPVVKTRPRTHEYADLPADEGLAITAPGHPNGPVSDA
eukprot:CAMPEP_0114569428 /NCGR_PEP_ID=MMETSP0114-20121206/16622_1 /TAXON_ID=31324 /ORGANISM="Goniomonas sp, Strain m" /LENGTH=249 /DNA_ID=CAMNT_0001756309 /DNA_START=253 /DNA_END=998 /DNA_ORIENTATION=-